jgi:hypothetical protein
VLSKDGRHIYHFQIPKYTEDLGAAFRIACAIAEQTRWYELCWRPNAALCNFTGNESDYAYGFLEETGGDRAQAQCLAIVRAAIEFLEDHSRNAGNETKSSVHVRVEYDPAYYGGNYDQVGQFVEFDVEPATDREVGRAFERLTGLLRSNIVHWEVVEAGEPDA